MDHTIKRKRKVKKNNIKTIEGDGIIDNIKGFITGREAGQMPPNVRKWLQEKGNEQIIKINVCRRPIEKYITDLINVLSLGQFKKKLQGINYDKIFHLYMEITTNTNNIYGIEKNEVINMFIPQKTNKTECRNINMNGNIKNINELFNNTKQYMGLNKFSSYDPKNNNCQDFILSILKANRWGNNDDYEFIKQDANKIFSLMPEYAYKISKFITDTAGRFNILKEGQGLEKYNQYKFMPYEKIIIFDPVAEKLGVSKIARGKTDKTGFMEIYKKYGKNLPDFWIKKRFSFISRVLPEYIKKPTVRRLISLYYWAYDPLI